MSNKKGNLLVISAPSGTGKTTLCKRLVSLTKDTVYSVSVTSRPPRTNEINERDYLFVSEEEFKQLIEEKRLIEWAKVHGNYYGTSKEFVEKNIQAGKDIILDVDVKGALQIKEKFKEAVLIFLLPPSMGELRKRLTGRKQDSEHEIEKRLKNAYEEIEYIEKYDYKIVNDQIKNALDELKKIVSKVKNKEEII